MPDTDMLADAKRRYLRKLVRVMYPGVTRAASSAGVVVEVQPSEDPFLPENVCVVIEHDLVASTLSWNVDSQERFENWRLEVWNG